MLVISILCVPISYETNTDKMLENLNQNINHKTDDLRYLEKNKIALKVKMSKPQSYYLKGLVQEIFLQNGWNETDKKKNVQVCRLFFWLHKENFYGQTQLFNAKARAIVKLI